MIDRKRGPSRVPVASCKSRRSETTWARDLWIGPGRLAALAIMVGLLLGDSRAAPTLASGPLAAMTPEPFHFGVDPNDSVLPAEEKDQALRQEQIDVAQHLVEVLPKNADALFLLAMAYQEQGNSSRATRHLRQCLDLEPNRADAYDQLGRIAQEEGKHGIAVDCFLKAEQYNPRLAGLHYRLGQAYQAWNKPDKAFAAMTKSAELFPRLPHSYVALGELYLRKHNYEAAIQNYEEAIKLDPNQSKPYYGLATACARLGQSNQAAAYRQKFRQIEEKERSGARRWLAAFDPLRATCGSVGHTHTDAARILIANELPVLAEQLWRRAARLDPDNVVCRSYLADYYMALKRFDEALPWCLQVTRLEPDSGLAYFFLGYVCERLGRHADAEEAYGKVIEVSPHRPEGFLSLARLLWESNGDPKEIRDLVQQAVDLAPTAVNYAFLSQVCRRAGDREGALSAARKAAELAPHNLEYRQILQQARGN